MKISSVVPFIPLLCKHTTSYCIMSYAFLLRILTGLFLLVSPALCAQINPAKGVLSFDRQWLASESFESANVFDVDHDGILDVFSGSFWYKGPDFIHRTHIGALKRYSEYYDDFSTIVVDINKDGMEDVVTGGWFEGTLIWKENPGKEGIWKEHVIAHCGNIESTRAWDINGDGIPEIIPNTPGKPLVIYRITRDQSGPTFDSIKVADSQGHGLGYGDINGDGRGDLIIAEGWLESPADPFTQPWVLHKDFSFVQASVPMLAVDVNSDGMTDLIVGQGHDYGLSWYEQRMDKKNGRTWVKHIIDPFNSQFHTMEWEDIDNDGKAELITGKRYRAHDDHDPGAHDPVGLYYFKWNGDSFNKEVISFGKRGEGKGTGIYFRVIDINHDNWKDIIVAGKDGLVIFYNKGFEN